MEVALIPPYCMLDAVLPGRKYRMLLPECLKHVAYKRSYQRLESGFTMLDNGMFEHEAMSNEALIELGLEYNVDELVMPDVRGDMDQTFSRVEEFLNVYCAMKFEDNEPGLMIAFQVTNVDEIPKFITRATALEYEYFNRRGVFTYGIPRRLAEGLGQSDMRVIIADWLQVMAPHNPVHLLGFARTSIQHILSSNEIVMLSKRVRSIDTDAPFVWSTRGAHLEYDSLMVERPLNYFQLPSFRFDRGVVMDNIETLDRWAHA